MTVETVHGPIEAAALIGADGIWSRVRTRVLRGAQAEYFRPHRLPHHDPARARRRLDAARDRRLLGPQAHLGALSDRGGRLLNLIAVAQTERSAEDSIAPTPGEEVIRRFADFAEPAPPR